MDVPVAPTLTEKPGYGVEVYFPTLDADATEITVWRTADGLTEAVAGALHATVAGDFVVTDWAVPFGVVSSYTAEIFDVGGASVTGLPSTTQVESGNVVVSNPTDPEQLFAASMLKVSFSRISRPRRTEQVFVFGLAAPFEQNWGKGAIQGLPFEVLTDTDEQALELQTLLGSSPLLIRTPPRFVTVPRLLYASIKTPEHNPLEWGRGGEPIVWVMSVDEVQPTSKAIIRPLITWDDWEAAFPGAVDPLDVQPGEYLWDDVLAIYSAGTWTDAVRNPPIA